MKLLKGKLVACLGLLILGISLSGASIAALYFTTMSVNPSSKTCTVPQDGVSTSCNVTFNWTTRVEDFGEPTASRTLLINNIAVASSSTKGSFSHTVVLPIGTATYSLTNTNSGNSSGVITATRGDYIPLFTHSTSTHNTITGDFNGNGETDAYYQNKVKGTVGGIMPVASDGFLDTTIHKSWTAAHPQIPTITDWSKQAYAAFAGNFNSNPGDELLLLGTKQIILLHGDIITPITIFQPVNNAIVSWNASNTASHSEFEFDANPADFVVHVGDLSGDGYDEVFLQGKSKGSTSYILSNTGALIQTISNGYRNMDWSAASYTLEIINGSIVMTALNAADDDNIAYTNTSGVITSLSDAVTKPSLSGTSAKYVFEGQLYSFTPTVTNTSSSLTFSASGKPAWMNLNTSTGELSGTPTSTDTNQSHTITITVEENKSHTIKSSMSVEIEVTQTFTIGQVDYSIFIAADGTLYLVSVDTQEVIKIVDNNGSLVALLSTLVEYDESGASSLTGYQIVFEDINFDGHIDMVLVPDEGTDLERIVISYIDADVHEVIVGDEPMRSDLDHGPTVLPGAVSNPLDGLDSGTVVGSLPAEFSVKPSGSAAYDVPITVAPGSGGLVPNISIGYDSLSENGIMGVGWNIKGLSIISVCQRNREQDGVAVPSKFGEGTFCLNGKKLFPYGVETNRYATEDKTSINIIYDGSTTFTEYHTNGSKTIYKKESLDYLLHKQVDASGNYIEMVYETVANEAPRLERVLYTGNENTGAAPFNSIQFEYENIRADKIFRFRKGVAFNVTKRLSAIQSRVNTSATGAGGQELRTYTLDYIYGSISNRSLLSSITACRVNSCLPATTFDWEQGVEEFEPEYVFGSGGTYSDSNFGSPWAYKYLDFDGDGVLDYWKSKEDGGYDDLLVIKGGDTFEELEFLNEYLAGNSSSSAVISQSVSIIDYDNDGKDDLIFRKNGFWHILVAKKIGSNRYHDFDNLINTAIPSPIFTDNEDILFQETLVNDHNGDGYPDITYIDQDRVWIRYNLKANLTSNVSQNYFSEPVELIISGLTDAPRNPISNNLWYFFKNFNRLFKPVDLDGDGIVEYRVGVPTATSTVNFHTGYRYVSMGEWRIYSKIDNGIAEITSSGDLSQTSSLGLWDDHLYDAEKTYDRFEMQLVDLNADGLLDVFYTQRDVNGEVRIVHQLNDGSNTSSTQNEVVSPTSFTEYAGGYPLYYYRLNIHFVDYNSDGYLDLIHGNVDSADNGIYVRYFDGNVFSASESIPVSMLNKRVKQITDINADGILDYIYFDGSMRHQLGTSKKRDMIERINDGSSVMRTIEYSTSLHTKDTDAAEKNWGNGSLVKDVAAPLHLVKTTKRMENNLSSCDVTSCYEWLDFEYKGLKAQVGRGLLGYREFKVTNQVQNNIITNEYRQDFPFTGQLKSRTTVSGNAGNQSSTTVDISYTIRGLGPIDLPYPYLTTTKAYENGTQLSEKAVSLWGVDKYGRPGAIETDILEIATGNTYKTFENNTYDLHTTHYGGRLTRKTISSSRLGYATAQVSDFEYFLDTGLLYKTIIDPIGNVGASDADETNQVYGVTTTFDRDDFGNVISTTVVGSDGVSRFSKMEYDPKGRYPLSNFAYPNYPSLSGEIKTSATYHNIFGTKMSTTMANGQTSYLGYSTLGRLNFENTPDGTYTTTDKVLCSTVSDCSTRAYYKEVVNASHGPNSVMYFDGLGRKVEEKTQNLTCYNNRGLSGLCSGINTQWVHKIYGYNNKSQKTLESRPHFYGDLDPVADFTDPNASEGYATFVYDSRNRPITHYRADRSTWTTSYDGFSTTTTNPSSNATSKTLNALGELIQVTDANSDVVTYAYDALGSLRLVRRQHSSISGGGAGNNLDTVIENDHLGRKLSLNDPDVGMVEYRYNSVGELTWQKDNKGQVTITDYDSIGRVVETTAYSDYANTIIDSHIKSYYDLAVNGLGLLQREEDLVNGITQEFTYNVMSQPIREKTVFSSGRSFYSDVVYDSIFRVKETYDASNVNAGIEYGYYNNYLVTKTDKLSGTLLWKFLEADSIGSTKVYENGNGIVNSTLRDQNDGTIESIFAQKGNATAVQSTLLNFDNLGNLNYRHDQANSKRETFSYDEINRLKTWTRVMSGTIFYSHSAISYDHLGNVSEKTGIGFYQYGEMQCGTQAGPHAVTSAGSNTYCYDANGNMTSGGGRTNTVYNTNDKPTSILTDKNHQIEYQYGLGGSRFKRIDTASDGNVKETLYVGNVEFISDNGGLTKVLRHMEGVALETYIPRTGSRTLEFLHRDHLGSVELITDHNGDMVKKFSYDPWGQRRDYIFLSMASFNVIDSALDYALEDFRRGFTGHEHIDEAGLIHMNGRVYDPRLGRFLSADPFVKTTESLQSFNRYTYVSNNPLNATDPSGYVEESALNSYNAYLEFIFNNPGNTGITNFNQFQIYQTNLALIAAFDFGGGEGAVSWKGQDVVGASGNSNVKLSKVSDVDKDGIGTSGTTYSQQAGSNSNEPPGIDDNVWFNHLMRKNGNVAFNEESGNWELVISGGVYDDGTGQGQDFIDAVNADWSGTTAVDSAVGKTLTIRTNLSQTNDKAGAALVLKNCLTCVPRFKSDGTLITNPGNAERGGRIIRLMGDSDRTTYVHEFGHVLGLGHQRNSTNSIMSYSIDARVKDSDIGRLVRWYYGPYSDDKEKSK